ncbi:MAG: DNA repair protein RadC [Candidatus Poribacteria bacterium]
MTNRSNRLVHTKAILPRTIRNKIRNQEKSFRRWQIREGDILYKSSVQQLSNTHLLAHLLRNQGLAERLMASFGGLTQIAEASIAELKQISGVGSATAERIQAAFELSRRLIDSVSDERPRIASPDDVYMLVRVEYQGQKQEILKALLLNTQKRILKIETISIGALNFSVMNPREIYRIALRHNAASIILTHNHPSGSPEPSLEDIQATKQIAEAGKIMGLPLLDHVIIGNGDYVSLKEKRVISLLNVLLRDET